MNYTPNIAIVVTAAVAANLRELSRRLEKSHCDGMFTAALSSTGAAPATHYISHGHVPAAYLNAVTDNVRLFTIAKAAWEADGDVFPFTQTQVTNALSNCTISPGLNPRDLIASLGLQMIHPTV